MCLIIDKVGLGYNIQQVVDQKLNEGFQFGKLPKDHHFFNTLTFDKHNVRFVIGSDIKNAISFYSFSKDIDITDVDSLHIYYLEMLLSNHTQSIMSEVQTFFQNASNFNLLSAATNSQGNIVAVGTIKHPEDDSKVTFRVIALSSTLLIKKNEYETQYLNKAKMLDYFIECSDTKIFTNKK